ncbi:uncharacterized protein [Montipora foliosa]|uniref:uncharacterized protein n=1 Tax=Montipora foliosa TaxID=591990 RepID=UPI0035F16A5B
MNGWTCSQMVAWKDCAAQLNMSKNSKDGFVRPLWMTDPPIEGQESFFEGVPMAELGLKSVTTSDQNRPSFRSLLHKVNEPREANGFMLNHESKLEESLLKTVQEENLEVVEVLIDHYLQLFNLEELYENSSSVSQATPQSSRKTPVNFLPLVVAAHLGNYDVLKLFISKGFKLERPHDVLCKCEQCQEDYFRQSQKRLDIYRAMADPMWISLTGRDPFLTAFKLSKDLKSSAKQEDEFEKDYLALSLQCSQFALGLLDECKSSKEQTTVLNFPGSDASEDEFWEETLGLVHSAFAYGQKESFLGMLYHNENDSDGIQQVLTALHQYVSYYGDGDNRVYSSQGLVADQLSVERGVNALFELANGFTPEERLEGLHLEIADWHAGNKFLKVAFHNFYNTKSAGDKCTLYSDRNLINRRNVSSDVDVAVNPCRKFFDLEVKARLIAAALNELGMSDISDSPKGEFSQPNLPEASNMEKKDYVRKIATHIVDGYVIRRENVENIFNNLLAAEAAEEEEVRQQTDNGRYICFFPGCSKTFASRGKRMRDHEATHNQQVPPQDSPGLLFPSDSATSEKVPEKDDMFSYQCSFLEYGMLILNFFDAIKEGDGKRTFRCWKFQLPYLRNDPGSTKYALEALGMIFQVYALLSPKHAHELVWNRTVLLKSGLGHNIPLDLLLEFFNRLLKEVIRKLGPNATNHRAIDRYCHAIDFTKALLDNFDQECCVIRRSGHHYELSVVSDLCKIVTELITQRAFCWTPGRTYEHFHGINSTLLSDFDLQDMFRWITKHKKNIVRERRAR